MLLEGIHQVNNNLQVYHVYVIQNFSLEITELLSVNISVYFTSKAIPNARIKIMVRFTNESIYNNLT